MPIEKQTITTDNQPTNQPLHAKARSKAFQIQLNAHAHQLKIINIKTNQPTDNQTKPNQPLYAMAHSKAFRTGGMRQRIR